VTYCYGFKEGKNFDHFGRKKATSSSIKTNFYSLKLVNLQPFLRVTFIIRTGKPHLVNSQRLRIELG